MSEQTIQDGLYSIPVRLDKYICRSLGSTTIKDLVKSKEISGLTLKECNNIKANKPDVLVLNKLVDCLEKCLIYGHIRRFAD